MSAKILIVDDEENIVELLRYSLMQQGYETIVAYDGKEAKEKIDNENPNLILLDLMLPEINGFELCKYVRNKKETADIPIIMITAKNHEQDKYTGFEIGTDDYITKPFLVKEVVHRVKAVLRRSNIKVEDEKLQHTIKDLQIDVEKHIITKNGNKIELTLKEFELLKYLIENKGKVITRDDLLNEIWGYDYYGESRTVDVHIRNLRKKIENDDKNPEIIETIRGIGYKIKES